MGVPTFRWEAWAEARAGEAPGGRQGTGRLLDVGSRLCTNALVALRDRGSAVVAVDPSPNHLERLRCVVCVCVVRFCLDLRVMAGVPKPTKPPCSTPRQGGGGRGRRSEVAAEAGVPDQRLTTSKSSP